MNDDLDIGRPDFDEKNQPPPEDPSNDRATINRNNAQYSTGPKSTQGKHVSSLNAVKTALTGRTVLLANDDVELYKQHVAGWFAELKPEGLQEITLVQSIADSHWRHDRIVNIEATIFARGRVVHCYENDSLYGDDLGNPTDLKLLVDAQVNTLYERQLRNLHIQENRLRRHRERDMADLKALQQERLQKEQARTQAPSGKPPQPGTATGEPKTGFVFSTGKNRQSRQSRNNGKSRRKAAKIRRR